MTPRVSPEEVDAACTAARVPGRGITRMDMVAALEAAAEVREPAETVQWTHACRSLPGAPSTTWQCRICGRTVTAEA